MDIKKIELYKRSKKAHKAKKWFWITFSLLVLGIIVLFVLSLNSSSLSVFKFSIPIPGNPLKSTNDRVNILLLGNAGGRHDGPQLTDSIIIASYHLKNNNVTLISIPRDLWMDNVKAKVNAVYEIGERKKNGLKFAEDKIDDILGLPIHYGVRLDFNGFAQAIDLVEGIEVDVPKTFDDLNYPIEGKEEEICDYKEEEKQLKEEEIKSLNLPSPYPKGLWYTELPYPLPEGKYKVLIDPEDKIATDSSKIRFECRFEHIHFDKGLTHMDGETALKFVRSRMGTNGEGSDFARSRRQQLIIQAFRQKALSLSTLANPAKVVGLVSTLGNSIESDIPTERYLDLYSLVKKAESVESIVLGDLGTGKSIFTTPPASEYGGAFVLIPPDNDFTKVQDFLKQKLNLK